MRAHLQTLAARVFYAAVVIGLGIDTAAAGDVKGSVKSAPGSPKEFEPLRPAYWREWNGFIPPTESKLDPARDVTVVLIGKKGNSDAVTLEYRGGDLLPRTVVVQAGAGIRLRNTDDTSHELYAEGLDSFEPDTTRAGTGRQITVPDAGHWPLRDRLAAHVQGHLHVLEKVSAVAIPQEDGSFTFEDVDAGKYLLKVFYGPDEVASKPIEIPSGSRSVSVDTLLVTPRTR